MKRISMLKIDVILVDTKDISLDRLLNSVFLSDSNVETIRKFIPEETKKEKATSFILKNKYIRNYHLNDYQKPIADGVFFNVSHSNGVVVFVKDNSSIGIDIEKIREFNHKLMDYISSKEEKSYIKDEKTFFEIWTNKESLVKNIGTGIYGQIKSITSLPINGVKVFNNKKYYSKTIEYKNFIISVTRETEEEFEINIIEEEL